MAAAAVSSKPFSNTHRGTVVTEFLPPSATTVPTQSPYLQSLTRFSRQSLNFSALSSRRKNHTVRKGNERMTSRTREIRPVLQKHSGRETHRENSSYRSPRYRNDMGSPFSRLRSTSGDRFGSGRQFYKSSPRSPMARQASAFNRPMVRESSSVSRERRLSLMRQSTGIRRERQSSSDSRQGSPHSRQSSANKLSMRRYLYGNSVDIDPYAYFQHDLIAQTQEQDLGYTLPSLPEVKYASFQRRPQFAAYAASFRMPRQKDRVNHMFKYSHSVMCALNGMAPEEETQPFPQVKTRRSKKPNIKIATFEIPQDVLVRMHTDNTLRISMAPSSSTARDSGNQSDASSSSRVRTFSNASSGSESVSSHKIRRRKTAAVQSSPQKPTRTLVRRDATGTSDEVKPVICIN